MEVSVSAPGSCPFCSGLEAVAVVEAGVAVAGMSGGRFRGCCPELAELEGSSGGVGAEAAPLHPSPSTPGEGLACAGGAGVTSGWLSFPVSEAAGSAGDFGQGEDEVGGGAFVESVSGGSGGSGSG